MKKVATLKGMMMAVIAIMVGMSTLSACGGSDDDPMESNRNIANEENTVNGGEDNNNPTPGGTTFSYFVPCTQWGADVSVVSNYMRNGGWTLDENSSERIRIYWSSDKKTMVTYALIDKGLSLTNIIYGKCDDSDLEYVKSETEKIYGAQLTEVVGEKGLSSWYWKGNHNGRYTGIIIEKDSDQIQVAFDAMIDKE